MIPDVLQRGKPNWYPRFHGNWSRASGPRANGVQRHDSGISAEIHLLSHDLLKLKLKMIRWSIHKARSAAAARWRLR
jgi:hypothetical protein